MVRTVYIILIASLQLFKLGMSNGYIYKQMGVMTVYIVIKWCAKVY